MARRPLLDFSLHVLRGRLCPPGSHTEDQTQDQINSCKTMDASSIQRTKCKHTDPKVQTSVKNLLALFKHTTVGR